MKKNESQKKMKPRKVRCSECGMESESAASDYRKLCGWCRHTPKYY